MHSNAARITVFAAILCVLVMLQLSLTFASMRDKGSAASDGRSTTSAISYSTTGRANIMRVFGKSREYSRMNCTGDHPNTRSCTIYNTCYYDNRFHFYTSKPKTVVPNLPQHVGREEIHAEPLSTFDLQIVHSPMPEDKHLIPTDSYTIHQTWPINSRHHLNDDIIPLWWAMRNFGNVNDRSIQIVFRDEWTSPSQHLYVDQYKLLSDRPPLFLSQFQNMFGGEPLCFSRITVASGGKCIHCPEPLSYDELAQFNKHFANYYHTNIVHKPGPKKNVLLIDREHNRKIVNIQELAHAIETKLYVNVKTVQPEKLQINQIQQEFFNADVVVGIHGAGFGNMIFMRKNTAIVELWPYKTFVDFYQTYTKFLGLHHLLWRNTNISNTIFHDKFFTTEQAYIKRKLSQEDIKRIKRTPEWSPYWFNQDTIVDIDGVLKVVANAIKLAP